MFFKNVKINLLKKTVFPLVCFMILFSSCHKSVLNKVDSGIIPNEIDYSTVSISAKTKVSGIKYNLKSSLRMQKDSVFWCSVSAPIVGEAARTIILSDSAKMITKYPKKEYYVYSIAEFSQKYGLNISPFILQDVLVGNRIIRKDSENVEQKLRKENKEWVLEQKINNITVVNFIPTNALKIRKVVLESDTSDAQMNINYTNFEEVQGKVIPKNIQIQLLENKNDPKKSINLEFSISRIDFEVEQQTYPFKVSSKYTRKY